MFLKNFYKICAFLKTCKMKVNYFFRKKSPNFHSIEELFFNIIENLPENIFAQKIFCKYHTGIFGRLKNISNASKQQAEINHITGDINYISLLMKKQKTIITIHDIAPAIQGNFLKKNIIKYFWFKIPVLNAKYVTVISEFTKKQVIKYLKIPENKIKIIPNCVSPKLKYIPKQFNSEQPTILHIGTKQNKNLERIIQTLGGISCQFIVVGKLTESQLNLLKINKITFENFYNIPYEKIVELYQQADILSFATLYEGFGVPIIEANSTGTCVVTSNISPMKDVAGDSAILVNPYEIDEIKNAFMKIIRNENLRNNLIEKGLNNAEKYSAKNIARQYASLYELLLRESNGKA